MVANSRSTPARTGATALLNQVCHGLSGRLRRAWYMIRGSMPRARRPARRASLSYALSAYTAPSSPRTRPSASTLSCTSAGVMAGSTHDVSLDQPGHVGVVPRGLLALAPQAGLSGVVGAGEVERDPAQARQVARGPALADAA